MQSMLPVNASCARSSLRKDAQQRTAKTQRYADYLHQRSLFVQEKDRYQKDPNGLHGVEDGTGNRSRLTDAQQIAEHEPVESESSQTEQPYPLPPCDRCLLYKPACYPKCHGSKDTTHPATKGAEISIHSYSTPP